MEITHEYLERKFDTVFSKIDDVKETVTTIRVSNGQQDIQIQQNKNDINRVGIKTDSKASKKFVKGIYYFLVFITALITVFKFIN